MRLNNDSNLTRTQQVRRQDIIDAAIRVINAHGYAAASIQAVSQEANVSKGTVMYHFGSKEGLITAIVHNTFQEGAAYMKPRIDAATSMRDKLTAYITSNIAYIGQHVQQITAVHQVILNIPTAAYDDTSVYLLAQLFNKGQQSGEFCDFDTTIMARAVRHVIDGSSFYILENPTMDIEAYGRSIAGLFDRATLKHTK